MIARRLCTVACLLAAAPFAAADTVSVAVAANFADALRQLEPLFEQESGHELRISSASTGILYAQILHGAPYDLFLAADRERPERLIKNGLAEASSAFVYARGRLVLWSARRGLVDDRGEVLRSGAFEHLALANPRTAPYGAAAMQVLERLGLAQTLAGRLVTGESVAQAWHFVVSGNAELGFVSLSQPVAAGRLAEGSYWIVPEELYAPIEQVAVLLGPGGEKPAARAFMAFLRSREAVARIEVLGYAAGGNQAVPDAV
jgi:molybdate transport system substrate-binding protein